MAKALKSWSAKQIGLVQLQLAIAKEIIYRLEAAQDFRTLAPHELALCRKAKLCSLGLASLQRTLVRQRARITYLAEGDANTSFFFPFASLSQKRITYLLNMIDQNIFK